jgi:PilZ domain-containing protein
MGVIQECMPNAISVLVKQALAEGSSITIESGPVKLEGQVACCSAKGDRYEASIVVLAGNGIERRTQRFPLHYEVRFYRTNSESEMDGLIVDLSATGVGLEVTTPLTVGEILTFEGESDVEFAIVRYCRRVREGQFHAGLELFHSMPKEPKPSHHSGAGSLLSKLWAAS